jgi:hypothetical protein
MPKITVQTISAPLGMELDLSNASIMEAVDSSLMETIQQKVKVHLAEELQTAISTPEYVRSVRNWLMESLDYSYMSELVSRHFSASEIVEELLDNYGSDNPFDNDEFQNRLVRNTRFQMLMQRFVQEYLQVSTDFLLAIGQAVEKQTANLANEVAERVLTIIGQRLNGGADV